MPKNSSQKLTNDLIELYTGLLIPFMKVRRNWPFPTEPERDETDGEHAFSLAMIALTIHERLQLGLNTGKISQYALVHDLVEAHAGDVSARVADQKAHLLKTDREHEAYMIIKKQFEVSAPWIPRLIEAYESRADEESKFVYVVDKCIGALTCMAGDGARWSEYYPTPESYRETVKRLRKKASQFPALLELFDVIHDELDARQAAYTKANGHIKPTSLEK